MPINYEFQTHAECDECGDYIAMTVHRYAMIEYLRSLGWKIGKYVTCPKCVDKKGEKEATK